MAGWLVCANVAQLWKILKIFQKFKHFGVYKYKNNCLEKGNTTKSYHKQDKLSLLDHTLHMLFIFRFWIWGEITLPPTTNLQLTRSQLIRYFDCTLSPGCILHKFSLCAGWLLDSIHSFFKTIFGPSLLMALLLGFCWAIFHLLSFPPSECGRVGMNSRRKWIGWICLLRNMLPSYSYWLPPIFVPPVYLHSMWEHWSCNNSTSLFDHWLLKWRNWEKKSEKLEK